MAGSHEDLAHSARVISDTTWSQQSAKIMEKAQSAIILWLRSEELKQSGIQAQQNDHTELGVRAQETRKAELGIWADRRLNGVRDSSPGNQLQGLGDLGPKTGCEQVESQ